MTNKKSRFWTFCFSLIPGAGEMYMGFFKHGISVMTLFFLVITISGYLSIGPLLFLLPVLWFYSFFHVHSLKNMPDEEFYAIEDEFLMPFSFADAYSEMDMKGFMAKYKKIIAFVLILIGGTMIWQNFFDLLTPFLPDFFRDRLWYLSYLIPQLLIGIVILFAGIYLILGKKKSLDQKERQMDPGREAAFKNTEDSSAASHAEPNFILPPAKDSNSDHSQKGA